MSKTKVNKGASRRAEGTFFETFQKLSKQKLQLERQLLQIQSHLVKALGNKKSGLGSRKKYVPRKHNKLTLIEAIRQCMVPGEKMVMDEIVASLKESGLYRTNSTYFYTMVNNKLNRDQKIRKVSRGVFVLRKPGARQTSRTKSTKAA